MGLILTAVVFFPLWIPFVTGFISLLGFLYFLKEMKHQSDRWFLGMPLATILLAFTVSPILDTLLYGAYGLSSSSIHEANLILLAPTSAIAFLSFPAHQREKTTIFALISAGVSLYAVYLLVQLIQATVFHTSLYVYLGFLALYILLGMPLLGICYIVAAWITR